MARQNNRALYQLKVTLRDIEPPVWRRIQVWEDTMLGRLHDVLQIVMEWEDYHLHEFRIGRRVYSVPDPDDDLYERKVIDEKRERLRDVVPRVGTSFEYAYDFGDDWCHELLLEAILMPEPGQAYPRCIAGERRAPPEDVGGTSGYEEYLQALADSQHEEHENMLQWRGPFDPELFSLDEVNRQLQKKFRLNLNRKDAVPRPAQGTKSADPASDLLASMRSLLSESGIAPQKRKRIPPGGRIALELNARERELILNHTFADDDLTNRLRVVCREDEQPVYGFTLGDLDELAGYVAAEANHAKDRKLQKELSALCAKITALMDSVEEEN